MGQKQHFGVDSRKNRAMTRPRKAEEGFVKKTIRFPASVVRQLDETRAVSGRSFNGEVIARLQVDEIAELKEEVADLKAMLRQVLDLVRK